MRFTLTYDGPLPSTSKSSRLPEKQVIRRSIHRQLGQLFASHPAVAGWLAPDWDTALGRLLSPRKVGVFDFIPFVTRQLWFFVDLDILFLQRREPLSLVGPQGDIDNRVTTLFDALRMPKTENELPANDAPASGETPFLCLLEDDALITGFKLRGERLLAPPAKPTEEDHIRLVIEVTVKMAKVLYGTIGLLGD